MAPKQVDTKLASQHNIVIKHAFGLADSITVSVHEGGFLEHFGTSLFTLLSSFASKKQATEAEGM